LVLGIATDKDRGVALVLDIATDKETSNLAQLSTKNLVTSEEKIRDARPLYFKELDGLGGDFYATSNRRQRELRSFWKEAFSEIRPGLSSPITTIIGS
jgi:hypothetical protein